MATVASLYADHREIGDLCASLHALTRAAEPPAGHILMRLRWQLLSAMDRHLAAEEAVALAPLRDHDEAHVREAVRLYRVSHCTLRADMAAHMSRWPIPAVLADWKGYCRSVASQMEALNARMLWEEADFYPIAAQESDLAAKGGARHGR